MATASSTIRAPAVTVRQQLGSAGRGAASSLLALLLRILCSLRHSPASHAYSSPSPASSASSTSSSSTVTAAGGKTVRFSSAPDQVMHFSQGSSEELELWRCGRHRYCKHWDHSVFRASLKLRRRPAKQSMLLHRRTTGAATTDCCWSLEHLINYLQGKAAALQASGG